jgi:hypothetical protein
MNLGLSDDGIFKDVLSEKTILEHMKNLYFNVNGKIFPDTMAAIFTYISPWFFKCIDTVMYVLIAYCVAYIFFDDTVKGEIVASVAMLYFPMEILTSAGYVATSTNYVWTSAALFVVFLGIKKALNEKIRLYFYVFFTVALIYAGNQEQTVVIELACLVGVLFWYLIKKDKVPFLILYGNVLAICSLLFVMTAPGHTKRAAGYSIFRIPNFPQLDLLDKIYLGITTTIAHFLTWKSTIFIVFSVILICVVWFKREELFFRVLSVCPFIILVFMNVVNLVLGESELNNILHFNFEWGFNQETFSVIDASNYDKLISYLPILICGMLIVSILISFFPFQIQC